MTVFVLDNSVSMRWFFDSGSHPYADSVLYRLMDSGDEAIVPVLWPYEVSAVLSRAVTKEGIDARKAADFMEDLATLPVTADKADTARVFAEVHRLAVTYRLTSYDAAYLELAVRQNLPLATLDNDLIAACKKAGVPVL